MRGILMSAHSLKQQAGFGLLEILVSVLVLSVGLLGLAGLHVAGMRSNHSAYYRTQATILSYEIIDRMRVNAENARSGDYDVTSIAEYSETGDSQPIEDLTEWKDNLDVLPAFDGSIDCDSNGNCLVAVIWDDSRPERDLSSGSGSGSGGGGTGTTSSSQSGDESPGEGGEGASGPSDRRTDAGALTFSLRTRV